MTSRAELWRRARERGERYFETPTGCKRCGGHVFYVSTNSCKSCPPRATPSFLEWADSESLTGAARELARVAWKAAKGDTPMALDLVHEVLLAGPLTTPQIGAALGLKNPHVGNQLRRLRQLGKAHSVRGPGRVNIWRLTA